MTSSNDDRNKNKNIACQYMYMYRCKVRLIYSYCNFSPKLKTLTPNIRYFKDKSKINGRY